MASALLITLIWWCYLLRLLYYCRNYSLDLFCSCTVSAVDAASSLRTPKVQRKRNAFVVCSSSVPRQETHTTATHASISCRLYLRVHINSLFVALTATGARHAHKFITILIYIYFVFHVSIQVYKLHIVITAIFPINNSSYSILIMVR